MNLTNFENLDAQTLALIDRFLPESLKPVEKLIGLQKTMSLVHEFAGTVFVFPKTENGTAAARFAEIKEVVGAKEALLLGKYFGYNNFYVPRCVQLARALRDQKITRGFDELLKVMGAGRAANELARRYRLTARHIEMIVNGKSWQKIHFKKTATKVRNSSLS